MAYACDNGDGNTAALLITDLETGNGVAMCPNCITPLMTQFVLALGIELELPGQITKDHLINIATKRELDIATMTKSSKTVRENREAELAIVIGELAELVTPKVVDSTEPDDNTDQGVPDVGESQAVETEPQAVTV